MDTKLCLVCRIGILSDSGNCPICTALPEKCSHEFGEFDICLTCPKVDTGFCTHKIFEVK